MDNQNPESLHDTGKGTTSPTTSAWVNPGTPASALVKESDLMNAAVSPSGTDTLRSGLLKDR